VSSACHGLDVLVATAYSSDDGRALAQFTVTDRFPRRDAVGPGDGGPGAGVDGHAGAARPLGGAIADLLAQPRRCPSPHPTSVAFDSTASDDATVIDVHTVDEMGVLYRINAGAGRTRPRHPFRQGPDHG